jgi:hypothetical protein
MLPDHSGDLPNRDALIPDSVEDRTRRRRLQGESEEARCIEPVHCRPTITAIADVG